MFEELFELISSPLGVIVALGLLGTKDGRGMLRKATKFVIRTGLEAKESVKEIYREVQEEESQSALADEDAGKKRISTKTKTNSHN